MNLYRSTLRLSGITLFLLLLPVTQGLAETYAEDRAAIENLMARYLFALDFQDPEAYAATFTEDGIMNYASGVARGRQELQNVVKTMAERMREMQPADKPGQRSIPARHNIMNIVIDIKGDRATSRSYWTNVGADSEGKARVNSFGHYEDELVKRNGEWLFTKRVVFNEFQEGRQSGVLNPEQ
ncbi:MAG TPA: nuclear transport factor 2 family protein [Gammaproteobacteria bacterium]|nr:nuclear transport factor 2 family protein [Gammaproteobacteria bacterium]